MGPSERKSMYVNFTVFRKCWGTDLRALYILQFGYEILESNLQALERWLDTARTLLDRAMPREYATF